MSKAATASTSNLAMPVPPKTQEAMEKTWKANQAAAEKAMKAGKETAEKALKAGSEAVTKAYDHAVSAAKETVQKAFPQAAARFDELTGLQRANLEAMLSASTTAMKGAETMAEELMSFGKKAMEESVAGAGKILECKSLAEVMQIQADCASSQFDQFLAHSSKMADMALKLASEIAEPIQDRFAKAAEKLAKPLAA